MIVTINNIEYVCNDMVMKKAFEAGRGLTEDAWEQSDFEAWEEFKNNVNT